MAASNKISKEKIYTIAKEAILKYKLFFIDDIAALCPCSRATFYNLFPNSSPENGEFKEMLERNRIEIKVSMRQKWHKTENATLQLALMRLICTDEERRRLSMQYIEQTETIGAKTIIIKSASDE